MTDYRIEKDSLGEVKVPKDVYWGAQTQRAIENFPISGEVFEPGFIRALGIIKKSAAKANGELGFLEQKVVDAIVLAADEVISGELIDQFQVDVFQTGSGTSSNMNANEVIANRACEIVGEDIGSKVIHPNDHVNFGQSSNDIIPTAMHVSALESIDKEVVPSLEVLKSALEKKEKEFSEVVKTGRTHLQDATPITLGQEFGGYKTQIEKGIKRIENVRSSLAELPIGGTAVGTGLNMHPDFPKVASKYISEETGIAFREAADHFEAQAAHDAMSEAHAALRVVAGSMNKIANDLRLLASGPRNGLGEVKQPENQPGSSIMPGKINPVMAEAVNQVHKRVIGNDMTIAYGAAEGQLELNLYKPVLANDFLNSTKIISNVAMVFAEKFIDLLSANKEKCENQVEWSIALATSLSPHIGYDKAAKIAKEAYMNEKTVREVAIEMGEISEADADDMLDARRMTKPGILGAEE
ncbi:MAG: class II fumarate hydratase [Halobacteriales archaeon]|tara:strand:- start:424 stop:1830 length:1407 start_codon:yes stop_codon:yes gene_type:complete